MFRIESEDMRWAAARTVVRITGHYRMAGGSQAPRPRHAAARSGAGTVPGNKSQ